MAMDAPSVIGENGRMRIIAGTWRSRKIARPRGRTTRPMPDRVKEAIFSILASHFGCPGSLPQLPVADVFSGGGTMGLEALSRGAGHCTFFERDRFALTALAQNIAALDAGGVSRIVRGDAWRVSARETATDGCRLLFLDPPYRDATNTTADGSVLRYLAHVAGARAPDAKHLMVVLHHPAKVAYDGSTVRFWRIIESRRMGSSGVTFFKNECP